MDGKGERRNEEIYSKFQELSNAHPGDSPAISAIRTLLFFIGKSEGSTVNYLAKEMSDIVAVLRTAPGKSKLAIASACAQFIRFATLDLATIEAEDMSSCKRRIEAEGGKFMRKCEQSVGKIAKLAAPFIFDGAKLLVHSNSFVVLETLKSIPQHTQFTVYSTSNKDYTTSLASHSNITHICIKDSEIAYMMESIDLVLVGAEAVVKNGGIINQVGTLAMAICAKEMGKPMYVLAQSFKFSLLYPLNQSDLPGEFRVGEDGEVRVDYTPPKYLTLLVTDRGLLTPTAVCDELIEMYV
jgi:translation initiation factor eIF-2B subunit alpha